MALFPYIFLTVIAILASGVPTITAVLSQFQIGLPFPEVETSYGIFTPAANPYSPFAIFTHPGTYVLLTSLVALVVYRVQGYYDPSRHVGPSLIKNLVRNSVPSSIAIASFLTMSKLMDHSGQTSVGSGNYVCRQRAGVCLRRQLDWHPGWLHDLFQHGFEYPLLTASGRSCCSATRPVAAGCAGCSERRWDGR
jgi:L-lactate permease